MKIGIFGDSYADKHPDGLGKAWFEILRDRYNLDVTCFGQNGSSVYYSYTKFIEHHNQFDKIIFLVTGPGRLTLPIPKKYDEMSIALRHVTNYDSFKYSVNSNFKNDRYLRHVASALELYYLFLMDFEKDRLFHRLLIEEIRRVRPDGLYIPCFDNLEFSCEKTLSDIHRIDIAHYNLTEKEAIHRDIRHCHMNEKNNRTFAELIKNWVDSGDFDLDRDFKLFGHSDLPIDHHFHQGRISI